MAIIRSRMARAKMECSTTWHLVIDRGDRPRPAAWVTYPWTVEGRIRDNGMGPK